MLGEIFRRHAERIGLHLECALAAEECFASERVDFANLLVGHGVAAARGAIAVDHQLGAGAAPGAVIGVGVAHVEREIVLRLRIHLAGRNGIEAFRRLAVAFFHLGTEFARPAADRVGLEQREAAGAILLPDFEFGFLLEDANKDRGILTHVLLIEFGEGLAGERRHRARGEVGAVGLAAAKGDPRRQSPPMQGVRGCVGYVSIAMLPDPGFPQ